MADISHEHTIQLQCSPCRFQLASNGVYFAVPLRKTVVCVWSIQNISCKPLELVGHRRTVTGLCFGNCQHPTLLCSAAEDYVILWNIEQARASLDCGQQIRGKVISKAEGLIHYLALNHDDSLVAACVEKLVYILNIKEERVETVLEGHTSRVNNVEFCPHYTATVVTCSDDRTFKIWDLSSNTMIYQSTIISSSAFVSLAMNPLDVHFAVGTADGQLRVYDLTDGNGFRCLHHLNVAKLVQSNTENLSLEQTEVKAREPVTVSSRPSWQRPTNHTETESNPQESETELECLILDILYTLPATNNSPRPPSAKGTFLKQDHSLVNNLLEMPPIMVISTTSAILHVNSRTLEPLRFISLQDPMPSSSLGKMKTISFAGNTILVSSAFSPNEVLAVVGSLFQHEIHLLRCSQPSEVDDTLSAHLSEACAVTSPDDRVQPLNGSGESSSDYTLSVLSCSPLLPNSPLKAELSLKPKDTKQVTKPSGIIGVPQKAGTLSKKGDIIDKQPIVYHSKVKSSGYSKEQPRRTFFQPKTNIKSQEKGHVKSTSSIKPVIKEYPMNSDAPTRLVHKQDVSERPTAINTATFSDDGKDLLCALSNGSAQSFHIPLSSGKGCSFAGHKGVVTSASWSHDSKLLITSGDDKMAAIWSSQLSDPVMTMELSNNNFGADKEGGLKPDKDNALFPKPVRFGQFYYVDKFIMLTQGSTFSLYKYHLETSKSDIKRYLSNNRYKLVKTFTMTDTQQITAFSAINSFHSYLALCCGTNKMLEVFDLNVGQSVMTIPSVHTKAPHVICQNQGSAYVSHASHAYDLFVTAAATDGIKLWDLRSNRCVQRYEGHYNRAQPCGLAISPCSRFIATGSEDRCAYIFDVRSGTYLHKLTGHTDTVSDVAFHPLHPQLLTASLDGKIKLFVNT